MTPTTREQLEAQLVRIADELDALQARQTALFAQRVELWTEGRDVHGMKSRELARPSRVRPVTVRNLTPGREE